VSVPQNRIELKVMECLMLNKIAYLMEKLMVCLMEKISADLMETMMV